LVNHKFMQSVDKNVYNQLTTMAKARGVSVQELLRAVIIADWMSSNGTSPRKAVSKSKN
jgi:predicted HicB family RNase H-like nuclease